MTASTLSRALNHHEGDALAFGHCDGAARGALVVAVEKTRNVDPQARVFFPRSLGCVCSRSKDRKTSVEKRGVEARVSPRNGGEPLGIFFEFIERDEGRGQCSGNVWFVSTSSLLPDRQKPRKIAPTFGRFDEEQEFAKDRR